MKKNTQNPTKGQIIIYPTKNKNSRVEVRLENDTVWLTLDQMAILFARDKSVISRHISNVFKEEELERNSVVAKYATTASDGKEYQMNYFSLDVIISVGYRVKSHKGTQFRIWATSILRDHILKGYTMNKQRLEQKRLDQLDELQDAIKLLKKVVDKKQLKKGEALGLLHVISEYTNTWIILNKYDENRLNLEGNVQQIQELFEYDEVISAVTELKNDLIQKKEAAELFGNEHSNGLSSIINNVFQSFAGSDLYPSIDEKAAHLLYFVIKNHPFSDGNKRIGAFLFILFLVKNNHLFKPSGEKKINDNALVAIALLVAESNPRDKDLMVRLIINLIQDTHDE